MTADYTDVAVDLTADNINVAVDPDVMPDPPLEIRIIPAPPLWDDIGHAHQVPVFGLTYPNPTMHRWGKVTQENGVVLYHTACGLSSPRPAMIRYDHARRFARHCKLCTRTVER